MAILERDEISRSLAGAWALFLDRPDALRLFDISVKGFWRSFGAIVLLVPGYVLTAIAERQAILSDALTEEGFSEGKFILDKALALGLDWIALPILLALFAGPLGVARTYPAFVIARNWGAVLAVLPFAVVSLLYALGFFGGETAQIVSFALLIVILRYNFLIARRALDVGIAFAIGLVIADLALSLVIAEIADWVVGI